MAYDLGTGQLLHFGGFPSEGGLLGDTWTWNGSTWTELSPASNPQAITTPLWPMTPAPGQPLLDALVPLTSG